MIDIKFECSSVHTEPYGTREVTVEATGVEGSVDEIFDSIKDKVDHDDMMKCLSVEEVKEHFGLVEEE